MVEKGGVGFDALTGRLTRGLTRIRRPVANQQGFPRCLLRGAPRQTPAGTPIIRGLLPGTRGHFLLVRRRVRRATAGDASDAPTDRFDEPRLGRRR